MKVTLSKFLSLAKSDFVKGFFMAVGGAIFSFVRPLFESGNYHIDFTRVWHTAMNAAIIYIGVKFFSPAPTKVIVDTSKTDVIDANTKKLIA